ncbi:MAG: translation repressor RelE [Anaerocolumna sp.]|jgi:plasmid stabilization system protein ParE|nr:translation repressor RelE [Anaerocolumna sp.]
MERRYNIEYLPIAAQDLTEIIDYIKIDDPQAAMKLLDDIDDSISKLELFPDMGTVPKDLRLQSLSYRILIIESYHVFYIMMDDIVEIHRIISGKRKYNFLL